MKVLINSQSRLSSSASSSNFSVQLPQPFYIHDFKYIRLAYCQMYNTIYNVTSANNNVDFKVSGTSYVATVTAGTYNASTLATALASALNTALSNSFTVTYNSNQLTYTIAGTTAFQLLFSSGTHASTSLWSVLGLASSNGLSGIDTSSATSTTSTQVVQLNQPLYVNINLSNIPSSNIFSSDGDSFSYIIPIDQQPGSVIEYDSNSNFDQYIKIPSNLSFFSTINVSLTTRKGTSVSLNGSEFMMVLEFVKEYTSI